MAAPSRKLKCPVRGCLVTWGTHNLHFVDHYRSAHVRCGCGWVGVAWGQHIAQKIRWGVSVEKCRRGRLVRASDAEIRAARREWAKAGKLRGTW